MFLLMILSSCKNLPSQNQFSYQDFNRLEGQQLPPFERVVNDPLSAPQAGCPAYLGNEPTTQETNTPAVAPPPSEYPFGDPHSGALKVFASKFQTCKILDNILGEPNFTAISPGVLDVWANTNVVPRLYPEENPSCVDATKFKKKMICEIDGGKKILPLSSLNYSQCDRDPKIQDNTLMVLETSSDCSSFIATAFMAVGLKMSTEEVMGVGELASTYNITEDQDNGKGCFDKPKITDPRHLIEVGSIMNMSKNHVFMIDQVGPDPLGVEAVLADLEAKTITKAEAITRCQSLNLKQMNIGIIHSARKSQGEDKKGNGIVRETAKTITSETATSMIQGHARGACTHFVKAYPEIPAYDSSKGLCKEGCGLLKHKGNKDPRCVFSAPPKIQGEECVNGCLQNYR